MSAIVPGHSVKRLGSAFTGASEDVGTKRSRKPVAIPEDAWLDVLKHLSGLKWSKMRLVSRQLNGVVQRNVTRLPLAIIDGAEIRLRIIYSTSQQKETESEMIVSDSAILPEEQDQWFKNRGITIDMPGDIQLNDVVIGVNVNENCCAALCVLGPAQAEVLTPVEQARPWFFGHQFKAKVLFYAEFSPHRNSYSWASMEFFLKLLYDQSTFVKKLSMDGFGIKLKEILFVDEEERYIQCSEFILRMTRGAVVEDICKSVSWLEQNVQADIVQFPNNILYNNNQIYDVIANYLFGSSWISDNQVVKLGEINDVERFFGVLIKTFPTVAIQSVFPTIVLCGYQSPCCDLLNNQVSGKWIVKEKMEYSKDDSHRKETYIIFNGANRMQIKFIRLFSPFEITIPRPYGVTHWQMRGRGRKQ